MKKLVFAVCMIFGAVVVNAQDSTSNQSPTDPTSTSQESTMQDQEEGRVKIKSQDLPDAVKSSLEGQEFRGWLVSSAYKMDASSNAFANDDTMEGDSTNVSADSTSQGETASTGAYKQEVFIIELKNGAQTKTVRFDKDGKKLDDEENNDDQK